ncbi:MAG: hypothetical protein OEV42_21540, partial [Deltaproteobacteria bacterium]|nr:hypothetical protein [Deltaproteobacteria bacterium]
PLRNLQHTITRILLHGTTGTNEQFPGQDFNLLDMLPITAYGPALSLASFVALIFLKCYLFT